VGSDKLFIISHCISCPNCGTYAEDLWREPYPPDDELVQVSCLNCGESWLEHAIDDSDDD